MHIQSEMCNFAITSTEYEARRLKHYNIVDGFTISEIEK
jgi:hypothetical protein